MVRGGVKRVTNLLLDQIFVNLIDVFRDHQWIIFVSVVEVNPACILGRFDFFLQFDLDALLSVLVDFLLDFFIQDGGLTGQKDIVLNSLRFSTGR